MVRNAENNARHGKQCEASGKRCKKQKTRQNVKNGAKCRKRGLGSIHGGCSKHQKPQSAENGEPSKINASKPSQASYKCWTLATAASNVGRCHCWRPTTAGGRQHASFGNQCILTIWMQYRCKIAAKWVQGMQD